jgi:DNA-binding transcriptional ArsR family regulator
VDYLSATFAALSDPTRRSIVDRLTDGPATVNELAEPFSISQQAVSKHLAYLETARLIERQRDGRQNFCALKPNAIREVAKWAEGYRRCWEKNFQRLDALLDEMKTRRGKARLGGDPGSRPGRSVVAGMSAGARMTKK